MLELFVLVYVTSSAQSNYALRVLRCHGLSDTAVQRVYRATVVARLTYAASAWRGFTKASDRQRIITVIDRARRLGYCSPDLLTFDELCDIADDELFSKVVRQTNHILHPLLPPPSPYVLVTQSQIIVLHVQATVESGHNV